MIRLTQHWTDPDGVAHLPGEELDLDDATERDLVRAHYGFASGGVVTGVAFEPSGCDLANLRLVGAHGPEWLVADSPVSVIDADTTAQAVKRRRRKSE